MIAFDHRLRKFLMVGGLCYLLNLLLLYCLADIAGLHYMVAAFLAFEIVNSAGYMMNRHYTFQKAGESFWVGLWKYNLVTISSCVWVLLSMYVLVDFLGLWYMLANIVITIVITGYNFLLHRKWTFK